jgi:hypothetical protein
MFNNSGPFTLKKLSENDVATAFASNVFPVPGGPYNNIPIFIRIAKGGYTGTFLHSLGEEFWVFERELDGIENIVFNVHEATDIVPIYVGDFRGSNTIAKVSPYFG